MKRKAKFMHWLIETNAATSLASIILFMAVLVIVYGVLTLDSLTFTPLNY